MKKVKFIAGAILRGVLFLSPGIISYLIVFSNYPVLVNIMSSIGVEFLALVVFSFFSILAQAIRDQKGK